MPIYKGTTEIENILKGTTEIQAVYQGTIEKWNNVKIIDLGTATTFNVASVYSKYNQLTLDDFFFRDLTFDYTSSTSAGGSVEINARMTKTYNANTGQLVFKYNETPVHAYLVVNSSKLLSKGKIIDLGSKTSFDVKNLPDYQNFTKNNFFYRTLPNAEDGVDCYVGRCVVEIRFDKSYSNGILSSQIYLRRSNPLNVNAFYIPTKLL